MQPRIQKVIDGLKKSAKEAGLSNEDSEHTVTVLTQSGVLGGDC